MNTTSKKKIALVNVLFPPKALGGATRVVVDEATQLKENYGDKFDVVVFCADAERRPVGELNVYPYDGYRVYAVSAHINNWNFQDKELGDMFDEFLAFEKPDIIHFHCIQVLTASIVEAAKVRGIPYIVTLHDAWWISDYQFLMDQQGKVYPDGHPDPFEQISLPSNVTFEQSIKRKSFLKGMLAGADRVLAVSDSFRKLYEKNGVANVQTNKNGISATVTWGKKDTSFTDKVVCAHIGGTSAHKGFDIFEAAVRAVPTSNLEILVVDHTKPENYSEKTSWGNTPVQIMGHVRQDNIANLYKKIDVLFAPSVWPESFGLVTREAAACGCWIVASSLGGIGEDVDAENGFVIEPTKSALIDTLKKLDRSPKKYKELSRIRAVRYSSDQARELIATIDDVFAHAARKVAA
jgi:glycosyltransferase involved in cell wall biosynthesis